MATSDHTRKIANNFDFLTNRIIDSGNFVNDFNNGRVSIFPGVDASFHIKFIKVQEEEVLIDDKDDIDQNDSVRS